MNGEKERRASRSGNRLWAILQAIEKGRDGSKAKGSKTSKKEWWERKKWLCLGWEGVDSGPEKE